jgi:hypothetical protein
MKRSPEERHTQTHGNLLEIFRQSQMSFSIKLIKVIQNVYKNVCGRIKLNKKTSGDFKMDEGTRT